MCSLLQDLTSLIFDLQTSSLWRCSKWSKCRTTPLSPPEKVPVEAE
jgi:hypothetical protein